MSIVNLKNVKKYLTLLTVGLIVSCTGASYPSNHVQAKEKSSFMTTSLKEAISDSKRYRSYEKSSMFSNTSKKSKLITTIPRKTIITPIHKIDGWFKVKYNNKIGWVSEYDFHEYFELKRYQTTESLALRSSPSSSSKKILTVPKSKIIMSAIEDNGWYQVMYADKKGWLSGKHLRFREGMNYFKTSKALSLYSTYSTKSKKLVNLPKSVVISSNQKHDGWYKTSYGKKIGWVQAKDIKPHTFPKPDAMDYGVLVKDDYAKANLLMFTIKESGSFYGTKKGFGHSYDIDSNRFMITGFNTESYTLAAKALSKMTGIPDFDGYRLALMSCRVDAYVSYRGLDFDHDGAVIAIDF